MSFVNAERGEVAILLDGTLYPMRPSYEAMIAIEDQLGSLISLSLRFANTSTQGLTIREMSVIVTEAIKAAGADRSDTMLAGYKQEKIAKLIAKGGPLKVAPAIDQLLSNMITGGTTEEPGKKKDEPTPPPIESPTAG